MDRWNVRRERERGTRDKSVDLSWAHSEFKRKRIAMDIAKLNPNRSVESYTDRFLHRSVDPFPMQPFARMPRFGVHRVRVFFFALQNKIILRFNRFNVFFFLFFFLFISQFIVMSRCVHQSINGLHLFERDIYSMRDPLVASTGLGVLLCL